MKNLLITFTGLLMVLVLNGQVPQALKYQAVVRDGSGNVLVSKNVSLRISILQGSVSGTTVYSETHSATSNTFGLVNLEIGRGMVQTGSFAAINWAGEPFFVKVDLDAGTGYVFMGTSQLLSVPYALRAKTVEMEADGDPLNEIQTLSKAGNLIQLSKGGGSVIDEKGDIDADTLNEIQVLGINGTNVSLSKGGGTIKLPTLAGGPFSSNGGVTSNTPLTDHFVFGSNSLNNVAGTADDSRFFFNKAKGAFRAGMVLGDEWDDANVGLYSFAVGSHTKANKQNAIAMGSGAWALADNSAALNGGRTGGMNSLAIGPGSNASAESSIAIGVSTRATKYGAVALGEAAIAEHEWAVAIGNAAYSTGRWSIAIGNAAHTSADNSTAIGLTSASAIFSFSAGYANNTIGEYSTALGSGTTSHSFREFVIGSNNTFYNPESATKWKPNDRLFVVGNGEPGVGSSDALVILKNGKTGIGTSTPTQALDVNGSVKVRNLTNGAPANAVYATSDGTLVMGGMSDARLKDNVLPLRNSLDKVMQLKGVTFNWKADPFAERKIGFIAQDFEKVIPELVFTNQSNGLKGINYAEVTAVLTEAIKELKAENDRLKAENEKLGSRLTKIENLIEINALK